MAPPDAVHPPNPDVQEDGREAPFPYVCRKCRRGCDMTYWGLCEECTCAAERKCDAARDDRIERRWYGER
jgi:hypothetical protein